MSLLINGADYNNMDNDGNGNNHDDESTQQKPRATLVVPSSRK